MPRNVRTNHVHVVVSAHETAEKSLEVLKARATRLLRERGLVSPGRPVWSRHGSTRYLWTDTDLEGAVQYVLHEQ